MNQFKDTTPEQKVEIVKILRKSRKNLFWIAAKYSVGLFVTNILSIFIGAHVIGTNNLDYLKNFQTFSIIINFIFMAVYLNSQINKNTNITMKKIQEVLNNKN